MNPGLLPPHYPFDLVAEEHVAQHQAAHHGLGLRKLGNGHIEIIKAGELRAPQKMPPAQRRRIQPLQLGAGRSPKGKDIESRNSQLTS